MIILNTLARHNTINYVEYSKKLKALFPIIIKTSSHQMNRAYEGHASRSKATSSLKRRIGWLNLLLFFSGFEGRMKLSLPPTKSWWWGMSSKWEMAHLTCPLMRCCFIVILRLKKIALQDWMMPSFTIYLYVEEYYVKELRMKKKTSKFLWKRSYIARAGARTLDR